METRFPHIFPINIDELDAVKRDELHIWGYEVWLVNDKERDVCCKLLIIFPGFLSSLHSHETKWEYFIVFAGELSLHIWLDGPDSYVQTIEMPADTGTYFIPEGIYHRFETATKQFVLLLEVSGYENERTDKLERSERIY